MLRQLLQRSLFRPRITCIRHKFDMAQQFVDELIKSRKVVVFSKTFCPFCTKAKRALASVSVKDAEMEIVELDNRQDCQAIQDYLLNITGARSVPRVFIGGECIGGGNETEAMRDSGELEKRLRTLGAI